MSYTVHEAKTNLSRLIKEAESGKEVIITRGKEPVAKLVPISKTAKKRIPDMLKGQFGRHLMPSIHLLMRSFESSVLNDSAAGHTCAPLVARWAELDCLQ